MTLHISAPMSQVRFFIFYFTRFIYLVNVCFFQTGAGPSGITFNGGVHYHYTAVSRLPEPSKTNVFDRLGVKKVISNAKEIQGKDFHSRNFQQKKKSHRGSGKRRFNSKNAKARERQKKFFQKKKQEKQNKKKDEPVQRESQKTTPNVDRSKQKIDQILEFDLILKKWI